MPVRQQTESSDSVEEQVKVAARLYEEDLRQLQTVQERRAATQAAEEMGIPAAYMERASSELAARQTARAERRRRRRASIAVAAVAVTATVGAWGISHRHTAPPTPLVYNFVARSQGQWHLGGLYGSRPDAQTSLSFPQEQGHSVALVRIDHFYQQPDYAVDLVTNQVPRPLTGYKTVSFRVRGQGLGQIRLFLQGGDERWCSPFLTASGGWHVVRLPLSRFLRQRTSPQFNPQDEPYAAPTVIGKISFRLGRDANPQDEHGEVAIDDLRFE